MFEIPIFGIGIAGNFAGHLQQTGEEKGLQGSVDTQSPQALFPFYVPGANESYLNLNPYSFDVLMLPSDPTAKVQMEPEIALITKVKYLGTSVLGFEPEGMTLFNDATYRNAVADKLAQKKNWGAASKGIASKVIPLSDFSKNADLDKYRFCSFLGRDNQWNLCCNDVSLGDYSYSYEQLIAWLVSQSNAQKHEGALHSIQELLGQAGYPERILISLGSSRYTLFGESHQLSSKDKVCAVLYDSTRIDLDEIQSFVERGEAQQLKRNHVVLLQECQ
ncbi:DUF5718 family protein [Vibrio sp. Y2-5]|uniref:DUF5718 family protein n=1 Tax=Vibrio sp. Y2-5 TaxID=2743977 RepID=UPI001CB6D624|nr:DUF5718 family protein [Vibrio sp. Y2-5]